MEEKQQACISYPFDELLTGVYARAGRIHLLLDNLSTLFWKFIDDVLGQRAAYKLLRRVEFHYAPNMPVGSTWRRSRLAPSAASAWIGASSISELCKMRSMPGSKRETQSEVSLSGAALDRMQTASLGVIMFHNFRISVLAAEFTAFFTRKLS